MADPTPSTTHLLRKYLVAAVALVLVPYGLLLVADGQPLPGIVSVGVGLIAWLAHEILSADQLEHALEHYRRY